MKKLYLLSIALLFVCLSTVVFAASPDPGKSGPQGFQKRGCHKLGPRLDLTQEQRGKMKELMMRFQADIHDLKYNIRIKKLEARKLFSDPKTDDATLLAKEKELNGLKLMLMDKKATMKVEWRKILTPEQIRMLDRIHWHHHGHWGHGRDRQGQWKRHHGDQGAMGKGQQQEPAASVSR
jgi:Spy/CpxP family protein refolding chaperone